jgi:class 3 adenylate cyclase
MNNKTISLDRSSLVGSKNKMLAFADWRISGLSKKLNYWLTVSKSKMANYQDNPALAEMNQQVLDHYKDLISIYDQLRPNESEVIKQTLFNHTAPKDIQIKLDRFELTDKVLKAFQRINQEIMVYKKAKVEGNDEVSSIDVVRKIIKESTTLFPQVMGWQLIDVGNGKGLPLEIENNYRRLMTRGGISTEDIAENIDFFNKKAAGGESRKVLVIIDYSATKENKEQVKGWISKIATELMDKKSMTGFTESSEKGVLNMVSRLGKGFYVLDVNHTYLKQDKLKTMVLKQRGFSSYAIIPMETHKHVSDVISDPIINSDELDSVFNGQGKIILKALRSSDFGAAHPNNRNSVILYKDIEKNRDVFSQVLLKMRVAEAEVTTIVNYLVKQQSSIKNSQNDFLQRLENDKLDAADEIFGAMHLFIDQKDVIDDDLLKIKIEAVQMFVNMAAEAFTSSDDDANNMNRLGQLLRNTLGDEFYTLMMSKDEFFAPGEIQERTILFGDIAGFTSMTEAFTDVDSAKEFLDFLNAFYERVESIIKKHGGEINNYIGDAVMALFPATGDGAIRSSAEIRDMIKSFNEEVRSGVVSQFTVDSLAVDELEAYRKTLDELSTIIKKEKLSSTIGFRLGAARGPVVVGSIGSKNRNAITAIGEHVNSAARLEALNKWFGIEGMLVTEDVLKDFVELPGIKTRELYPLKVIGASKMIRLFQVLTPHDVDSNGEFSTAIDALHKADLVKAHALLEELRGKSDPVVDRYVGQVELLNDARAYNDSFLNLLGVSDYALAKAIITEAKAEDPLNEFAQLIYLFVKEKGVGKFNDKNIELLKTLLPGVQENFRRRAEDDAYDSNNVVMKSMLASLHHGDEYSVKLANYILTTYKDGDHLLLGNISRYFSPASKSDL